MKILLLTPPFVQMNTPYPATPVLTGFLKARGADATQADISLELALALFSESGIESIAGESAGHPHPSEAVQFFLRHSDLYRATIEPVIAFLQGRNEAAGWLIARRGWLPEGPAFSALEPEGVAISAEENLHTLFGDLGVADRAKYLASLYLDDIAQVIREGIDPDFGFSRYAERLALSAPRFDPLRERLEGEPGFIDRQIATLTLAALKRHAPESVGITIPFPGTLYGALRIARTIKHTAPAIRVIIGGGYVNTELRRLTDRRIFDYVDAIVYDEGFDPWAAIIDGGEAVRTVTRESPLPPALCAHCGTPPHLKPDYAGLKMPHYFSLLEMPNPMHRIWSEGRWLKLQLANGCYWNQCAFCDTSLDYIRRYRPPRITTLIECIQQLREETGLSGFHFTDEALAPALIRGFCEELIRQRVAITWWGNIRFEAHFDRELAELMAEAGCIAVTGGIECANDRLLKLMKKGITLKTAESACRALSEAGILVHAYLMYGFPTQTRAETISALDFVRKCFAQGWIQSAYWHRFALTAHSPIAQEPQNFGIELIDQSLPPDAVFAVNEIPYREADAPDHSRLGRSLRHALYNYMLGLGLEIPAGEWF